MGGNNFLSEFGLQPTVYGFKIPQLAQKCPSSADECIYVAFVNHYHIHQIYHEVNKYFPVSLDVHAYPSTTYYEGKFCIVGL